MKWAFKVTRENEGAASGGTFLGSAPAADPAVAAAAANAAGVDQNGQASEGPPEYIPSKYWDPEKKAPRIEDLGRGYQNLEKMLGSEKIPLPSDPNDDEGWARYFKAAGWPEKPDDYEFQRPDLPKDLPYDEDGEKYLRTVVHGAKLNKKQAQQVYDNIAKLQIQRHAEWSEAQRKQRGELEMALVREHGPNVEAVKGQALAVMQQYADGEFRQYLDQSGLGNDPRMVRFLASVAKAQGGDTRLVGKAPPAANRADIQAQISDYRNTYQKALMDKAHPDHEMRLTGLKKLYDQMHE